jgi:hypothetical protein
MGSGVDPPGQPLTTVNPFRANSRLNFSVTKRP